MRIPETSNKREKPLNDHTFRKPYRSMLFLRIKDGCQDYQ